MLEIRHLETLTAIRDGGSLQEAAERLHLTQSALSHQLRDLETRLGTPLLNRRTRPARLTTAGLRVLALADEVLPRMRATEQELQRLAAGRSGRLHLAIDCHSCFQWLMPALDAFRAQWPDVALDLSAAFSFAPLPALVRGDLDLVITSDPQPLDAVDYLPLFKYELVLAVSESIPGRQQVRHAGPAGGPDADHLPGGQAAPGRLHRVPGPGRRGAGRDTQGRTHPIIAQLVASNRGVAALPNWALTEYMNQGWLRRCRLGPQGYGARSTPRCAARTQTPRTSMNS